MNKEQKKTITLNRNNIRVLHYNNIAIYNLNDNNTAKNNLNSRYKIVYFYENNFKKLERSLKKYNVEAYKRLMFEIYPKLRSGEFVGELVFINYNEHTETYDLKLPTDQLFIKVYGEVILKYTVNKDKKIFSLNSIEPKEILLNGLKSELAANNGMMIKKLKFKRKCLK